MNIHLLLFVFLGSCATLPKANRSFDSISGELVDQRIYVASHGWHTGIIMEPENLNHLIPELAERFPDSDYYEIGWGDSGFYQANKISAKMTLNAVFLPSETVIHLVGFKGDPVEHFSNSEVRELSVSAEGMLSLCLFVKASFVQDERGNPVKLREGLYGDSQFYEGQGKYHLFNGCNKWTAKALYSGGVDIDPLFKISSPSVMSELGTHAAKIKTRYWQRRERRGF